MAGAADGRASPENAAPLDESDYSVSAALAFAIAMGSSGPPVHPPAAPTSALPTRPAPAAQPQASRPPLAPHNNRRPAQVKRQLPLRYPTQQRPPTGGAAAPAAARDALAAMIGENLAIVWDAAVVRQERALRDAAAAGATLAGLAPAMVGAARHSGAGAELATHFINNGTHFVKRATECAALAARFNAGSGGGRS